MKNNCLFTLLEVGIGVKGLQVADQDIVTHFVVNLCRKDVLCNSCVHSVEEHTYVPKRCKTVIYCLLLPYLIPQHSISAPIAQYRQLLY